VCGANGGMQEHVLHFYVGSEMQVCMQPCFECGIVSAVARFNLLAEMKVLVARLDASFITCRQVVHCVAFAIKYQKKRPTTDTSSLNACSLKANKPKSWALHGCSWRGLGLTSHVRTHLAM
jgi:hypothetical protein